MQIITTSMPSVSIEVQRKSLSEAKRQIMVLCRTGEMILDQRLTNGGFPG